MPTLAGCSATALMSWANFDFMAPAFTLILFGATIAAIVYSVCIASSALKHVSTNGIHIYLDTKVTLPVEILQLAKSLEEASKEARRDGLPVRIVSVKDYIKDHDRSNSAE